MAIPLPSEQEEDSQQRVVSPFAQTTATVVAPGKHRSGAWIGWTVGIIVGVIALGVIGFFVEQYLNDPYRTMEPFPVDKYMSDFRSLSGSKFKGELKVSADLGFKQSVGRLMVFTIGTDTRPIVVLIPPKLASTFFTKGQNYQAALEVQEGGLIYADSIEKD